MLPVALLAMLGLLVPIHTHDAPPAAPVVQHIAPLFEVARAQAKEPTIPELIDEMALAADIPTTTLRAIAWCESQYRQFDDAGAPLIGITQDIGLFQLGGVHLKNAQKLGLSIASSTHDNIAFALLLYKWNGTRDWKSSKHCWAPLLADPRLIPNE